jgi:hypothetical protein
MRHRLRPTGTGDSAGAPYAARAKVVGIEHRRSSEFAFRDGSTVDSEDSRLAT